MKRYEITYDGITYGVDYYVELLGVLSILCDDQEKICDAGAICCNEHYVKEVQAFFKETDYKPLTLLLEQFSDEYNFNFDAPVNLMLLLSNDALIDRNALFYQRKPIPYALFDSFLDMLHTFEHNSGFNKFYNDHMPVYETLVSHFIADYSMYNSHEFLLSTLDLPSNHVYHVNLMLGITNANYGVHIGNTIYANLCPYSKTRYGDLPDYSYSPIYYSTLIAHEFAHSFINPITSEYSSEISRIDPQKYDGVLDEHYYGDSVETLINETVIRAIECMYVKRRFADVYDAYVQECEAEGFSRIRKVITILSSSADIIQDYPKIIALF